MRIKPKNLFGFFCLIFLLCPPGRSHAEDSGIFIDPSDPTIIRHTVIPFESEVILRAGDLPTVSATHPNVAFGEQRFSYLQVSPNKTMLAFSVDGSLSDWSGLYNLRSKKITQVGLSFDAEVLAPYWSGDGHRVVFEQEDPNHRRQLLVFDLETEGICTLDGLSAKNKYLDFFSPWWNETGDKVYFRVEVNNVYRRSTGLKPLTVPSRIGEASTQCQNLVLRSVDKFMAEVPIQSVPQEVLALSPKGSL